MENARNVELDWKWKTIRSNMWRWSILEGIDSHLALDMNDNMKKSRGVGGWVSWWTRWDVSHSFHSSSHQYPNRKCLKRSSNLVGVADSPLPLLLCDKLCPRGTIGFPIEPTDQQRFDKKLSDSNFRETRLTLFWNVF